MDLEIEVKPQSGYIFSGWKDKSIQIPQNNRITFGKSITLIPIFTKI